MSNSSKPSIIGTGLISLDFVTNVQNTSMWHGFAGGTCGNVLAILGFLGWDSFPIARLNGDNASRTIRKDLKRWGVNLDYASLQPTAQTPIIVQTNSKSPDGSRVHRFSWRCPNCKQYLPGFAPVRRDSAAKLTTETLNCDVFFFDRVSSGILLLAQTASEAGAIVFFEPSAKTTDKQMSDALQIANIVKYSDQRYPNSLDALNKNDKTILEIQTRGNKGLVYRAAPCSKRWRKISATKIEKIKDTAGAGDWFTASLVNRLLRNGRHSLNSISKVSLDDALRDATAAAAWSCQFEGARGGMYVSTPRSHKDQVRRIKEGKIVSRSRQSADILPTIIPDCPACP